MADRVVRILEMIALIAMAVATLVAIVMAVEI